MEGKSYIERALLEQYILGLTTEEECKEVELFLEQHPNLAAEVMKSQAALGNFATEYTTRTIYKTQGDIVNIRTVTDEIEQAERVSKSSYSTNTILLIALVAIVFLVLLLLLYVRD